MNSRILTMAKLKEIEIKWDATAVNRFEYNRKILAFLNVKKLKREFLKVAGFDYYYTSKNGDVVRHRVSKNTNELTIKARLDNKSTTVRTEINMQLSKQCSLVDVTEFFGLVGIKRDFEIYKDCDIWFIQDGQAEVSIVWYKVSKPKMRDRIFMEVEVHNVGERDSMRILKRWTKVLHDLFGLSDKDVLQDSLYEIYSGKRYKLIKEANAY